MRRLNPAATWFYLVHVVCVFLLPLFIIDDNDARVIGSVVTALGFSMFPTAANACAWVLGIMALSGLGTLLTVWYVADE